MDETLIERVAAVCHEAWMHWTMNIALKEHVSVNRLHRWQQRWVPYERLSEADKEKDRMWARKMLAIMEDKHS